MTEFIGKDPPYQVDERAGDLYVWYHDLLLGRWPWHTHVHVDEEGGLHLFDLATQRWIRDFAAGGYTCVNRMPAPTKSGSSMT